MKETIREKGADEKYCSECGKIIKRSAVFCEHCGTRLKEEEKVYPEPAKPEIGFQALVKSKVVAITLAAIFGFWSWLYTYKRDAKKFWVYLCLLLPGSVGVTILLNLVISGYSSPAADKLLVDYGTWVWLYILVSGSSYVWALVNSIKRPISFYNNYPY
jgi:hypothetical protein